ncbi:hypothetical protein ACT3S7_12215 [Corynebacterium sp. AOP34-AQ2-28]|uniref:hypothetical protein n=1 Tax=Corynebacterium sp. AOP34-AQ2-28 TaxID=3457689 RepID=UPI0040343FCB
MSTPATIIDDEITTPGGPTVIVTVPTPDEMASAQPSDALRDRVQTDVCVALHDQVWVPEVATITGDADSFFITSTHLELAATIDRARWVLPVPMPIRGDFRAGIVALMAVTRIDGVWVSHSTVMLRHSTEQDRFAATHPDHHHDLARTERGYVAGIAQIVDEMAAAVARTLNDPDDPRDTMPKDVALDDYYRPVYPHIDRDELRDDAATMPPFLTVDALVALRSDVYDLVRLGRGGYDRTIWEIIHRLPWLREEAGWIDPDTARTAADGTPLGVYGIYVDASLDHVVCHQHSSEDAYRHERREADRDRALHHPVSQPSPKR